MARRRRFLRFLFFAAVFIVLILAVLVGVVYLCVDEAAVRFAIEGAMEENLGRECSIGGVQVGLGKGVVVRRLRVESAQGLRDKPFLDVKEMTISPGLLSLVMSGFRSAKMSLSVTDPVLLFEYSPEFPAPAAPVSPADGTGQESEDASEGGLGLGPIESAGMKIRVQNCSIGFLDASGKVTSSVSGDVGADIVLEGDILKLSGLKLEAFDGKLSGTASADLSKPDVGHEGNLKLKNLSLNRAATESAAGKLATSNTPSPSTLTM